MLLGVLKDNLKGCTKLRSIANKYMDDDLRKHFMYMKYLGTSESFADSFKNGVLSGHYTFRVC